jgi:nucleoid DNA-binding protein
MPSTLGACRVRRRGAPSGGESPLSQEILAVTKKEIVKTISDAIGLTQLKTKEIVQKTFDAIVEALVEERRIELRNFGVFEVKRRAARRARNPRTGDAVFVGEKFVVTFKPGKEMEERVRQLEREAAARSAAPRDPAMRDSAMRDSAMRDSAMRDSAPRDGAPRTRAGDKSSGETLDVRSS